MGLSVTFLLFEITRQLFYTSNAELMDNVTLLSYSVLTIFWPTILGLVFLTIGYAFKKGLELQQENDLTV